MSEKLRVDKWLWYARFFKTRTLASQEVTAGHVRLNGQVLKKASSTLKVEDVLTFPKANDIRVIKVLELGSRRGPAPEAQALYEDLDPPKPRDKTEAPPVVERGGGRPTKKSRRDMEAIRRSPLDP